MKYEVLEVSGQSGGEVSADYRKLNLPDPDGTRSEDTVLVCLARNAYLLPMSSALEGSGFKVAGACPNSVALFTAFAVNATYREDETALLVHVGAQGMDLAIQRGGELLFARNASPGGGAFTAAVASAFSTTEAKAETLKLTKGDVTPRGQARYTDGTAEKVANAIMATAGQIAQLVQSTLMIGRAQTKMPDLKVDRVLLAGGGASLKGLDAYLKQAMGVPVERFDPFEACDLSELSSDDKAAIEAAPHEFAVALGLAQTPLAPAAFRLEVVPEAVRKKRDFATKGVFAVAAGAVAAGALGILYSARNASAAAVRTQTAFLTKEENVKAVKPHRDLAEGLAKVQEAHEKHRRLAELGLAGTLFSDGLALLQSGLQATTPRSTSRRRRWWWTTARASYVLLSPKPGNFGGFAERTTSRPERASWLKVVGHVSPGASPERVFNDFVSAVKAGGRDRNLVVRTRKTFQAKDGRFELEVLPGVTLKPKDGENSSPWMLRNPQLGAPADGGEPTEVTGTTVEGLSLTVKKEQVAAEDWKALVESLPAKAAEKPPMPPVGGN